MCPAMKPKQLAEEAKKAPHDCRIRHFSAILAFYIKTAISFNIIIKHIDLCRFKKMHIAQGLQYVLTQSQNVNRRTLFSSFYHIEIEWTKKQYDPEGSRLLATDGNWNRSGQRLWILMMWWMSLPRDSEVKTHMVQGQIAVLPGDNVYSWFNECCNSLSRSVSNALLIQDAQWLWWDILDVNISASCRLSIIQILFLWTNLCSNDKYK